MAAATFSDSAVTLKGKSPLNADIVTEEKEEEEDDDVDDVSVGDVLAPRDKAKAAEGGCGCVELIENETRPVP